MQRIESRVATVSHWRYKGIDVFHLGRTSVCSGYCCMELHHIGGAGTVPIFFMWWFVLSLAEYLAFA